MLQLMCLTAMEPSSMTRTRCATKLKILRSLRRINGNEAPKLTVRGQYGRRLSGGAAGYAEELGAESD